MKNDPDGEEDILDSSEGSSSQFYVKSKSLVKCQNSGEGGDTFCHQLLHVNGRDRVPVRILWTLLWNKRDHKEEA